MNRKWLWAIAGLVLVLALGLWFLLQRTPPVRVQPPAEPGKRIFAFVARSFDDPVSLLMRRGCLDEAKTLNVSCEFAGPERPDGRAQARIVQDLVRRKGEVEGIAIVPADPRRVAGATRQATAAGIPVVAVGASLPSDVGSLAVISTDNESVGFELGRLLIRFAPRGATYAVITGDPDAPDLKVRLEALRKQLRGEGIYAKGAGQYSEVAASPYATGGATRRALDAVDRAIKDNPDLTGIVMLGGWALFDPEAYKRAIAPKETELKAGTFVVVSFDVSLPQLVLVKEGFVTGLIGQRPYQMGRKSIELLYDYATKLKRPERAALHSGIEIVIRGNVERFIGQYQ